MGRRILNSWIMCLCACLLLAGTAGAAEPSAGTAEVSRGAFVDALYDAHVANGGTPVVSEGSAAPFRDVGSWSPYFEALCWAKASGIAGGYAGGAFRPSAPVTRQQAAVMLYRYAQTTDLPLEGGSSRDLSGYRDADTVPDWSREAVCWAVHNGLWYSGSAVELRPDAAVSQEELGVLTECLFQSGMAAVSLPAAPEGLTLELRQCSTTGATLLLKNETEAAFSYGASYGLYRQVTGGWYEMNGEMAVTAIAHNLGPGESQQLTRSWGYLDWAGLLPAATYGISVSGELTEEAWTLGGESAEATVFATFAIR